MLLCSVCFCFAKRTASITMTPDSAKKDSVRSSTSLERLPAGNTVENDGDEVLTGRLQRTLSVQHAPDHSPGAFSIPGLRSRVTTTTPESSVSGDSDDVTIRNMEEAEQTIVALAVDEEDERQRIQQIREVARLEGREEGIQEALRDVVEATDATLEPSGDESSKGRRCRWPLTFLSAGVVFVVAIVVTVYFLIRNDPNPPTPGSTAPTSATVSTTIAPTKTPAIAPVSTTMPSTKSPTVWPTATPTGPLRLKQLGLPIYGSDLYHYYGSAVDINGNGTMVAIGADADNIGEEGELCLAEVHQFSESLEKWVRVGSSVLAPRNVSSLSITSVFLSNDGDRLLLFAGGSLVLIYNLLEDDWVLGVALTASNITTRSAGQIAAIEEVKMSADGSTRMVMILERESSPEYPIVHAFDTTDGLPIGAPIYGSEARGIAVSSDATVVSVFGISNTTVYRFDGFYFNEMGSPLPGGTYNYDQVLMSGVGDLVVT